MNIYEPIRLQLPWNDIVARPYNLKPTESHAYKKGGWGYPANSIFAIERTRWRRYQGISLAYLAIKRIAARTK
jgi:hypothetical protein